MNRTAQLNQASIIHSGRLLVRFDGYSYSYDPIIETNGDQPHSSGVYEQFKPYNAILMSDRTLELESCSGHRLKQPLHSLSQTVSDGLQGDRISVLCYEILHAQLMNSHTFALDVISSNDMDQVYIERVVCHAPQSKKSKQWFEMITHLLTGIPLQQKTSGQGLIVNVPIQLTIAERTNSSDEDGQSNSSRCFPLSIEPAHLVLSSKEIQLKRFCYGRAVIRLKLDEVLIRRNRSQNAIAPNTLLLLSSSKEYTCQTADPVQHLVISTMLELWMRLYKLGLSRNNGKRDKESRNVLEGRILIGPSLHRLDEVQVCVRSGTKVLECLDMYGTFEKLEILHSDLIPFAAPDFYACRLLARQILPDYEADHMRQLFIRAPSRHVLYKWHQYFNLSPIAVLSILNVIVTELESRHHLIQGRIRLNRGDDISYEHQLDPKHGLKLFHLTSSQIATTLSTRSQWPNSRVEQLLLLLLSSSAHPIIKIERQSTIENLMLAKGSDPVRINQDLPHHMANILRQMTTFSLCVINRLALYITVGLYRTYPKLAQMSPFERLCLMQKHWTPLVDSLCHRGNQYGLSNKQDRRTMAISCFVAAYHYLLHTMMIKLIK
ncbi:unnamed protein product [Echinostoma caproni]|uniref:PH domain-containing protein n=1 Tax=Echinostoma caproni TaxID=27848 RepID=A0A183B1X6_9TREM|nr:unnamed protein product [Echinostoma caproni]